MAVNLPPRQKTAILLMSLPPEASAEIFRELGPEEVQSITTEISKLPQISPETRAQVIQEFLGQSDNAPDALKDLGATTPSAPPPGFPGLGSFPGLGGGLTGHNMPPALSNSQAMAASSKPLDFLRRVDPRQLLQLIRREHPQTIAVVLSHLQTNQASAVLGDLPNLIQTEVAKRLADLDTVSNEVLSDLSKVLETRLQQALEEGAYHHADGKETLLEILNQADRNTEERVLSGLSQKHPTLVSDIKNKLCDFEDLNNIDDNSMQQVLRLTDYRDLVLAIKGANRELAERIYKFLSPKVASALRNDVDNLGQVPWDDIKQAQQQIRNILRGLVTLGKIKFM